MFRTIRGEKGEGRIGLLVSLVVLIAAAYAAYVVIPIKVKTYEFQDRMRQEARFGANHKKDNVVHDRLMTKARQLGLPLKPENLVIVREGGMYVINAEYTMPVNFMVYQTEWTYTPREQAPIF